MNESKSDLSLNNLINTTKDVIEFLKGAFPEKRIIVVGHSMGGGVATRVVEQMEDDIYVAGLVVIDVVEGTAMEALPFMESMVKNRP